MTASLRDPAGRLLRTSDRILRFVWAAGRDDVEASLQSAVIRRFLDEGRLIGTEVLGPDEIRRLYQTPEAAAALNDAEPAMVLEHDRVFFPAFPWEWCPAALTAAGALTLDLAESLLDEGLGLKDATPLNVLFRGTTPVFVDLTSVEKRDPRDPLWRPQAQFERTFLTPLALLKFAGLPLGMTLLNRPDGIDATDALSYLGWRARLRPSVLPIITLPAWLSRSSRPQNPGLYKTQLARDPDRSRYVLRSALRRLRRSLNRLRIPDWESHWTSYAEQNPSGAEYQSHKLALVEKLIAAVRPRHVLDVGCNTGDFSAIAARSGATVVALDADPATVSRVWSRAERDGQDVQPLLVNLARPTGGVGWRNQEWPGFLDRTRGRFECVLLLAVIHHLMVTEGIPIDRIAELIAEITTDACIAEFVPPEDQMFQRLTRGRDALYAAFNADAFEKSFSRFFSVDASERMSGTGRVVYLFRRR